MDEASLVYPACVQSHAGCEAIHEWVITGTKSNCLRTMSLLEQPACPELVMKQNICPECLSPGLICNVHLFFMYM